MLSEARLAELKSKLGIKKSDSKSMGGTYPVIIWTPEGRLVDVISASTDEENDAFLVALSEWLTANPTPELSVTERGSRAVECVLAKLNG